MPPFHWTSVRFCLVLYFWRRPSTTYIQGMITQLGNIRWIWDNNVLVIQACNNISSKRVHGGCGASNNLSLDCRCDTASCRADCSSTLSSLFCSAYIAHWNLSWESVVQRFSWLVEWTMLSADQASCNCSSSNQ